MILRYATVVFVAVILAAAAAAGLSATQPGRADAAVGTVTVKTCTGTSMELTSREATLLRMHNDTRRANNLPQFCVHPALMAAARWYSQDMINRDYYHPDHTSYNGETTKARLQRFGYTFTGYSSWGYSENIGAGHTVSGMYNAWMNSPGHKKNILNRDRREIGIGARVGTWQGKANYPTYVVDFGNRSR